LSSTWSTYLSVVIATTTIPNMASAAPPRSAFELSAQAGLGHTFGKESDRSYEIASGNGGPTVAIGSSFRTPYLFVPWIELGWAELQWSRERPKNAEFARLAPSNSKLTTSYLLLGPAVEEGPFRFRAGIGLYHTQVTSSFAGHTITPSSWDMGYFLAYGLRVQDGLRYGWGLEAIGLLMSESQLAYLCLAVRVWGNAWAEPH
jgi:hypothetical protein